MLIRVPPAPGCDRPLSLEKALLESSFPVQPRCRTDHIHHSAANELQLQHDLKKGSNPALRDWASAPHSSVRSGLFHYLKVVPSTAAKRASQEEPLPRSRLAQDDMDQTHVIAEELQASESSTRTPRKLVYMAAPQPGRQLPRISAFFCCSCNMHAHTHTADGRLRHMLSADKQGFSQRLQRDLAVENKHLHS